MWWIAGASIALVVAGGIVGLWRLLKSEERDYEARTVTATTLRDQDATTRITPIDSPWER